MASRGVVRGRRPNEAIRQKTRCKNEACSGKAGLQPRCKNEACGGEAGLQQSRCATPFLTGLAQTRTKARSLKNLTACPPNRDPSHLVATRKKTDMHGKRDHHGLGVEAGNGKEYT